MSNSSHCTLIPFQSNHTPCDYMAVVPPLFARDDCDATALAASGFDYASATAVRAISGFACAIAAPALTVS